MQLTPATRMIGSSCEQQCSLFLPGVPFAIGILIVVSALEMSIGEECSNDASRMVILVILLAPLQLPFIQGFSKFRDDVRNAVRRNATKVRCRP